MLQKHFDVTVNEDKELSKAELIKQLQGKDALLCTLNDKIDAEVLTSTKLKAISSYNVGINNIDVKTATQLKIPVCYMADVSSESTADLAFGLILAVARKIVETDRITRAGEFTGWKPGTYLGTDVYGKTLGIVGIGNIGHAVARRAQGFNMKIIYVAHSEKNIPGCKRVPLEDCLKQADFVSLSVPLTPETRHLIKEKELGLMKKTAILINTARGPVVDEKALVKALQTGMIAGAGLDVYEDEPKLTEGLANLKNVVLTPHTGSSTVEARTEMSKIAAENIIAIFQGTQPHAIANPEVLEQRHLIRSAL